MGLQAQDGPAGRGLTVNGTPFLEWADRQRMGRAWEPSALLLERIEKRWYSARELAGLLQDATGRKVSGETASRTALRLARSGKLDVMVDFIDTPRGRLRRNLYRRPA